MSQPSTALQKPRRTFKEFIRADKTQRVLVIVTFTIVPLVLLLMFTYIPFGAMIDFSFYNRTYLNEGTFVGLQNYMNVLSTNGTVPFWSALLNTFKYAIIEVPFSVVLALIFAVFLNRKIAFRGGYRTIFFLPSPWCGSSCTTSSTAC